VLPHKVKVIEIPIDLVFAEHRDKIQTRQEYGLAPKRLLTATRIWEANSPLDAAPDLHWYTHHS